MPGEQATLTASATGATVCQWYVNRGDGAGYVAISGATDMTYTTSAVTLDNDGYTYYCEATNLYGTARSAVFTLRVREPAAPPQTAILLEQPESGQAAAPEARGGSRGSPAPASGVGGDGGGVPGEQPLELPQPAPAGSGRQTHPGRLGGGQHRDRLYPGVRPPTDLHTHGHERFRPGAYPGP